MSVYQVRMAEWSKALCSGRSPLLRAWVQIPLLTNISDLISLNFNKIIRCYKTLPAFLKL